MGRDNYSIEDYLDGKWEKHNDIFGNILSKKRTAAAFSHFSWFCSGKKYVILDVQGVGETYTDPAVVSIQTRKFGYTDTGLPGIRGFFQRHQCNEVCQALGLEVVNHIPDSVQFEAPERPLRTKPPPIALKQHTLHHQHQPHQTTAALPHAHGRLLVGHPQHKHLAAQSPTATAAVLSQRTSGAANMSRLAHANMTSPHRAHHIPLNTSVASAAGAALPSRPHQPLHAHQEDLTTLKKQFAGVEGTGNVGLDTSKSEVRTTTTTTYFKERKTSLVEVQHTAAAAAATTTTHLASSSSKLITVTSTAATEQQQIPPSERQPQAGLTPANADGHTTNPQQSKAPHIPTTTINALTTNTNTTPDIKQQQGGGGTTTTATTYAPLHYQGHVPMQYRSSLTAATTTGVDIVAKPQQQQDTEPVKPRDEAPTSVVRQEKETAVEQQETTQGQGRSPTTTDAPNANTGNATTAAISTSATTTVQSCIATAAVRTAPQDETTQNTTVDKPAVENIPGVAGDNNGGKLPSFDEVPQLTVEELKAVLHKLHSSYAECLERQDLVNKLQQIVRTQQTQQQGPVNQTTTAAVPAVSVVSRQHSSTTTQQEQVGGGSPTATQTTQTQQQQFLTVAETTAALSDDSDCQSAHNNTDVATDDEEDDDNDLDDEQQQHQQGQDEHQKQATQQSGQQAQEDTAVAPQPQSNQVAVVPPPMSAQTISPKANALWEKLREITRVVYQKTLFLKYGKKGNPHRRYLSIKLQWDQRKSQYSLFLCWQDVQQRTAGQNQQQQQRQLPLQRKQESRRLSLDSLRAVHLNCSGVKFSGHLESDGVSIRGRKGQLYDKRRCFSLVFGSNPQRSIDLLALKDEEYQQWTRSFVMIVDANREPS
eukprot:TRINITY_DN66525_c4_g2_i1.p1 TRINITY_DN66525_c4_g2~~TRINITY_DN66525_c4_g2_i1.p1  ORF type:complete len:992 (-),score=164.70 TRINITY_DN66525_c4_g2_i1:137-2767(-)